MTLDSVVKDAKQHMEKALEHLRNELRGIRTGRASTGLVDGLRVEVSAYGSQMGMKELANVAVADGNVIVIKPYDPSTLKDIQKAIEKSELGINPQNDGKMIRLPVPPLSTERRNQLATRIKQIGELQRVATRNVRRDSNQVLETAKKDKVMPEDDVKRGQDQIQKITDEFVKKIDALLDEKTKEVMES